MLHRVSNKLDVAAHTHKPIGRRSWHQKKKMFVLNLESCWSCIKIATVKRANNTTKLIPVTNRQTDNKGKKHNRTPTTEAKRQEQNATIVCHTFFGHARRLCYITREWHAREPPHTKCCKQARGIHLDTMRSCGCSRIPTLADPGKSLPWLGISCGCRC